MWLIIDIYDLIIYILNPFLIDATENVLKLSSYLVGKRNLILKEVQVNNCFSFTMTSCQEAPATDVILVYFCHH